MEKLNKKVLLAVGGVVAAAAVTALVKKSKGVEETDAE